jgi:hypothetical protein
LVTPSGLAHEPESEALDLAISADSNAHDPLPKAWRSRKAATNLGIAVHAVLEWLDLESQSKLAAWSAAENGVAAAEVARLARRAVLSTPVQRAIASSRYWREVSHLRFDRRRPARMRH